MVLCLNIDEYDLDEYDLHGHFCAFLAGGFENKVGLGKEMQRRSGRIRE